MAKKLPPRPNLDHLRSQAKALLAALQSGDADAVATMREHLPAANGMSEEQIRKTPFRLADAQSAIARDVHRSRRTSVATCQAIRYGPRRAAYRVPARVGRARALLRRERQRIKTLHQYRGKLEAQQRLDSRQHYPALD